MFAHAELASETYVADKHHLGADVLAVLEHFVIAHAVRAAIAPCAVFARTSGWVAQCLFPIKAVSQRDALDHAASWPAEEGGLQVGQILRHVLTQAVRMVFERWREEGNVVYPHLAQAVKLKCEARFAV